MPNMRTKKAEEEKEGVKMMGRKSELVSND